MGKVAILVEDQYHCCPNYVILSEAKNLITSRFFVATLLRMTNANSYLKITLPSVFIG